MVPNVNPAFVCVVVVSHYFCGCVHQIRDSEVGSVQDVVDSCIPNTPDDCLGYRFDALLLNELLQLYVYGGRGFGVKRRKERSDRTPECRRVGRGIS
jgi:hypothetical protein